MLWGLRLHDLSEAVSRLGAVSPHTSRGAVTNLLRDFVTAPSLDVGL